IKLYYDNKIEIETKKDYYDRILRIMTHEIRNTVTPIISLTDHYINHSEELSGDDVKEGLKIINSQSHNLKVFLDSYHTLTHLPEPSFTLINTTELFGSIGNLLRGEPGGDCIEILRTNVSIKADPVQMQLLLSNLLRNAMQAIEGYNDGKITVHASISDKKPFITITDNGCGIAPERLKDIFLPFYTTKEKGSGIGLSLCRQIMLLHGGELTVESNPQKRITTFIITFPAV
ncbi:MAG: HAMP domain-containing histidine kinase, partial [Bacteroidaceae bacterium]|nr:HAMP domain-containing histidine kinase [Bacteroidaceae bacterium]